MAEKGNKTDIINLLIKEHSTTYSLVKKKPESDHISGASCQFPGNKEVI